MTPRTDVFTPAKRSEVMRAVKGANTKPEIALRRALFARGLRYRLHGDLPGKPDLVFPGRRAVIFVHGCFWHGHDCARGARVPKTNRAYWTQKVARNLKRDAAHAEALAALGWRSLVVWECDMKDIDKAANEAARWLFKNHPARKESRHDR
jgi:DNA mismatch endonuclease (patch repair protein)